MDPEFPDRVYKVEKALYGLHQAPRAWYETLSTYLLDNRFIRATIDKTLFIKKIKDDILLVQVYVDDIIFGSTKRSLSTEFEQLMHKRFQMSSIGELTFFLGLQTKIYVDNESAICVVKNLVYHSKTKHIHIRHHFIRDSYEKRLIEMVKIHTDYNVADLLTKAFNVTRQSDKVRQKELRESSELKNRKRAVIKNIKSEKVVITKASIRHDLKLNEAEGTSCLPNVMIFEELAKMSTMASTIICLANNQKFNFSKYILDNLKKNLEAAVPFYMFPSDLLFSVEDSMPLKELMVLCTLSNKVLDLENEVIEMKSSHKAKIVELESRVEKLEEENMLLTKKLKSFNSKVESPAVKETVVDQEKSSKQGRKITYIDANAEVNLENVYNLDLAHEKTVLSMHDAIDADGEEVAKEVVEVITIAKIIVDEVSTGGGELNAADEEPISAAPINITTAQPSEATKITVNITIAPKAKGIVFHDVEESTTRTAYSKAHVKDKGKAKLVEEPKVLKLRKAQIVIDEEVARRI
nr:uncharacterized mitochondrial protein AtMg00810-like [Tanacetum cinerariifolium]